VSKTRAQRIAERIQEELSEMLIFEIQDPRLSGASITDVTIDRELAFADIYVSSLQGSESAQEILVGFNHASGFLRRELARRIELRTFPILRFHWDPTPERAAHIERLFGTLGNEQLTESENESSGNGQ
jgi:ribosome-binding factor A